jgi:hypothetical protein
LVSEKSAPEITAATTGSFDAEVTVTDIGALVVVMDCGGKVRVAVTVDGAAGCRKLKAISGKTNALPLVESVNVTDAVLIPY